MTSQQPHQAGQETRDPDLFGPITSPQDVVAPPTASFGSHLRAAREARGLSLEACAHALRLPVRVLRQIESDEHAALDHQVYLASYLGKYGRYLGIDESSIQAAITTSKRAEPELVATGGISHSRYLLERYATAATYVVLTAVIIVPVVWLGLRGTLDHDVAHLAPLDASPVAQQEVAAGNSHASAPATLPQVSSSIAVPPQPLVASMVPNLSNESLRPEAPAASASTSAGSQDGAHGLVLSLPSSSWVEVVAQDGSRLEYGLLPAGSKTYRSDQPLDVRIGNANGAQVQLDGQPVALDNYRHSNVAHFRVVLQDGKATPAGF